LRPFVGRLRAPRKNADVHAHKRNVRAGRSTELPRCYASFAGFLTLSLCSSPQYCA
jgi:hypothetical protein